MKYWRGTLIEYNGEKEYTFDYLIPAKTETQAYRILEQFARGWYEQDKPKWDEDTTSYDFYDVIVRVRGVSPITKVQFIKDMLSLYTLA